MNDRLLINCMLYVGDVIGSDFKISGQMKSVLKMDYSVFRRKDAVGKPGGHMTATMNIRLKLGNKIETRPFLEQMKAMEPSPFTILANPKVEDSRITDFRNGIVVWGYVMRAEEIFNTEGLIDGSPQSSVLELCLELNEIKYLGDNAVKELHIFHES